MPWRTGKMSDGDDTVGLVGETSIDNVGDYASFAPSDEDSASGDKMLASSDLRIEEPLPAHAGHGRPTSQKLGCMMLLAAGMAALGGFLFGYDIGVISGALLQLEKEFDLDSLEKELVVSLMLVGAMLASITGGYIVDFFGRRDTIVINAVIFIVGALMMTLANSYALLLVGRIVVGFGVSLSATAEVIYISEIAPPAKRGLLVSLNEMGITIGVCISYLVNYAFIHVDDGWRYMFGLSMVPALIQAIGMGFLPRSPRWLVMNDKTEAARASLLRLRLDDPVAVADEIDALEKSLKAQKDVPLTRLVTDSVLRKALIIGCGVVLFQQFTGHSNVLYYGSTLLKAAGFSTDEKATLANVGIGVVKVLATIFSLSRVDHYGRRKLLMIGTAIMIASLIVLASVTAAYPPVEVAINATNATNGSIPTTPSAQDRRDVSLFADVAMSLDQHTQGSMRTWGDYDSSASSSVLAWVGYGPDAADVGQLYRTRRRAPHHRDPEEEELKFSSDIVKWTSLASMLVFVTAYAFSYGPVSWLVLSEVFPDSVRGRAVSIATIFNWGGNLIVSLSFLTLLEELTFSGAFFFYAGIGVGALIFVFVMVPETKEKSFEEIQAMLRQPLAVECPCTCGNSRRYNVA